LQFQNKSTKWKNYVWIFFAYRLCHYKEVFSYLRGKLLNIWLLKIGNFLP
jgi:hypothetical protein